MNVFILMVCISVVFLFVNLVVNESPGLFGLFTIICLIGFFLCSFCD